jgi:Ankyrin repeats (3 copies)
MSTEQKEYKLSASSIINLIYASKKGDVDTIKFLVSKGINCNSPNLDTGETALHHAMNEATVMLLHNAGADLNTKDHRNLTPLIYAISENRIEVAKTLISLGAELSDPDTNIKTARQLAQENGQTEIVSLIDQNLVKRINLVRERFAEISNSIIITFALINCHQKYGYNYVQNFLAAYQRPAHPNSTTSYRVPDQEIKKTGTNKRKFEETETPDTKYTCTIVPKSEDTRADSSYSKSPSPS